MEGTISDKNYPIENIWILKLLTPAIFAVLMFGTIFGISTTISGNRFSESITSNLVLYFVILSFAFISQIIRKFTFHYRLNQEFLDLQQGFLSRQVRHIPYGVIQNVFVKQDILDRLLGLASLSLENASMGAGAYQASNKQILFGKWVGGNRESGTEMVGFAGNMVSIPGLKKENAEALKKIVLQKMKENPIEDSQSGL